MTETDHTIRSAPLIQPDLVDDFLRHLGVSSRPTPRPADLTDLYRRWCERLPYDNGRMRQALYANPGGTVISASVEELLRGNIAHGRSGQCTETAETLYCLLRDLGFEAYLCPAYYGPAVGERLEINHISVVVRSAGELYMVDTVLLSGRPIPLRTHEDTYPPLVYSVAQDVMGTWRIDTVTPVTRAPVVARLFYLTENRSVCQRLFAQIHNEHFADVNGNYYGRRNVDGEMITLSTSHADRTVLTLHRTSLFGTTSVVRRTPEERRQAMIDGLGFSSEYAADLPPDTPPA